MLYRERLMFRIKVRGALDSTHTFSAENTALQSNELVCPIVQRKVEDHFSVIIIKAAEL